MDQVDREVMDLVDQEVMDQVDLEVMDHPDLEDLEEYLLISTLEVAQEVPTDHLAKEVMDQVDKDQGDLGHSDHLDHPDLEVCQLISTLEVAQEVMDLAAHNQDHTIFPALQDHPSTMVLVLNPLAMTGLRQLAHSPHSQDPTSLVSYHTVHLLKPLTPAVRAPVITMTVLRRCLTPLTLNNQSLAL